MRTRSKRAEKRREKGRIKNGMKETKNQTKKIKVKKYGCISSTQEYAEKMKPYGEDVIITADRQSGGKGTKGRSFSSEKGGVYLSVLRFYENLPAKDAFLIMAGTCAAVCKTLEAGGLQPKIKWPNDVFVGGKKICGILTENTFSGENVLCSLSGIGINVDNVLPDELDDIATSVLRETGKKQSVKKWRERLIENLNFSLCDESKSEVFGEYEKRLGFIGENVSVVTESGRFLARILGVDETGRLRVLAGGEEKTYSAAEVTRLSL